MDLRNSYIGKSSVGSTGTPQIVVPNQIKPIEYIGLDIGGSLAKIVYFEKSESEDGGYIRFAKFQTSEISKSIEYISTKKLLGLSEKRKKIKVTGGGAHKFEADFKTAFEVEFEKMDEMKSLITGLNFLLQSIPNETFSYEIEKKERVYIPVWDNPFPYLLVNIGSGVSVIKVTSRDTFKRVDGSHLGGGTFWGLASLLTGLSDFDEILELCSKGDSKKVDLLVSDIYGKAYDKEALGGDVLASSFGRIAYSKKKKKSMQKLILDWLYFA